MKFTLKTTFNLISAALFTGASVYTDNLTYLTVGLVFILIFTPSKNTINE